MIIVFVPAVIAKTQAVGLQFFIDIIKMADAVKVFKRQVNLFLFGKIHKPFDTVDTKLGNGRSGRQAGNMNDCSRDIMAAAVFNTGKQLIQIGITVNIIEPQSCLLYTSRCV